MSRSTSPLRDRMVFLVGARRSGTNWLQRLLGAHPSIAVVPSETYLFSRGIRPLRERFHHGVLTSPETGVMYMDEGEMLDALRDFCDRALLPFLQAAPGAQRLVERTPEHATAVDVIGGVYPDAHVVHIIRDGRDVARSLLSQDWPSAPRTIEDAAREWRDTVEAAESAGRALERYRAVSYEELLADPLGRMGELYAWLGVPAPQDILETALGEAGVKYNVDPRAPAIGAGKWRETFTASDEAAFMRVAGETLAKHGYLPSGAAAAAGASRAPTASPSRAVERKRAFNRQVLAHVRDAQRRMDAVVAALNRRAPDELTAATIRNVRVRFVAPDEQWKGRGRAAWERLVEALRADPAFGWRQVAGDVHIAVPSSVAAMTYRNGTGAPEARLVVVTFNDERISGFTFYRLPLRA